MKLFSYVVARDYGFAPNPFYGICSLATCKPVIRRTANVGDWIIGTGTAKRDRAGTLVYAMQVSEILTYNEYWSSSHLQNKKPILTGSKKQAFGDNIYHFDCGKWRQENSHHSYADGVENQANTRNDTQTDRVLLSNAYVYFGGSGPQITVKFKNYAGENICAKRGHKNKFSSNLVNEFIKWVKSLDECGYAGEPLDWKRTP